MKKLVCEVCGSNSLIKQDGVFVCQFCGCKYTVEEARKLMIEGTVDVSGSTVKVDTSDELANLYQIARRAKDDNNSENAAKYYDMILVKDPTSWEAAFYVVYFKAMTCKIAYIQSAASSVRNCEGSVLALIQNYLPKDEQAAAVREVMMRSVHIASVLAIGAKSHYDGISADIKHNYTQEYVNNVLAARDIMYSCGTQIDRIFGGTKEIAQCAAEAWKSGIDLHTRMLPYLSNESADKIIMASYAEKIKKYDPAFAKVYLTHYERERLSIEITELEKVINRTPTHRIPTANVVDIVMGISFLLLAPATLSAGEGLIPLGLVFLIGGICLLLIGILIRPKNEEIEMNRRFVSDARKKLEEKRARYKALRE